MRRSITTRFRSSEQAGSSEVPEGMVRLAIVNEWSIKQRAYWHASCLM
jgi:hypothetical protein